jgi:spore germination protein GerM
LPPTTASRDRALYFIEVGRDGAILRTRVVRSIPATGSPLADTVRLLLQGPTVDERNRGLITLIPPGTGLQNAQVRGSTAYLSFSEEFQFNTYGVEGYIGQLRQIIWTATEFPNVSDVQILIEGRRIDYLGERIAIGSPLGRNSF